MARYEDSAAGWQIYKEYQGEISLEELNEVLKSRGFQPVARRSMAHYRKLARLGYDEYISMNRLDVRHASGTIFDITDRARYEEYQTEVEADLYVPAAAASIIKASGVVTRISDGFAVFVPAESADALVRTSKSTKYNRGVLRFRRTQIERAVQLREAVEHPDAVEILLIFRSLLSADLLFPERVAPTSRGLLSVALDDVPTLYAVLSNLHRSFDLFESLRGIVETLYSEAPGDERRILSAPRVERLTVASPLQLVFSASNEVLLLASALLFLLMPKIKDAVDVAATLQDMRLKQRADRREQDRLELERQREERERERERRQREREERELERLDLEIRAMQLAELKESVHVAHLLYALPEPHRQELLQKFRAISQSKTKRLEALKNQAVEAIAELGQGTAELQFVHLPEED